MAESLRHLVEPVDVALDLGDRLGEYRRRSSTRPPGSASATWERSSSAQPIKDDSGVPSWCAVSLAMPTQIVRFSIWRTDASPQSPIASRSSTPAREITGIHRSCFSTEDSP